MRVYNMRDTIRHSMLLLNFAIVLLLSVVFACTPSFVARRGAGLDFLQDLDHLPAQPWSIGLAVVGIFVLIVVSIIYREKGMRWKEQNKLVVYWLEPMLGLIIILTLHLDYNGLLLLIVVDLIDTMQIRGRMFFLRAMIVLYLLTSLDVLRSVFGMVSVTDYFICYDMQTRQFMQSTVGLLSALNSILFIGYMVLLFSQKKEENTAIRHLNHELEHVNDQLSVMNDQLKAYAAESERMAETRERNRLAREIHDTLGHALTGITAGADACLQMMEVSPDMAKKQMEVIAATVRQGISEVRRSVKALRPDALERFELEVALKKLCTEMQQTSHAVIDLQIETENLRLSPDEEDTVYRTIQEGITNAIRHGLATAVWIKLSCEGRRLKIIVQDNGTGCTIVKPGFGLRHMRERLNLLNGTLKWNGDHGFRIEAVIPLRWGDEV